MIIGHFPSLLTAGVGRKGKLILSAGCAGWLNGLKISPALKCKVGFSKDITEFCSSMEGWRTKPERQRKISHSLLLLRRQNSARGGGSPSKTFEPTQNEG